MGDELNVTVNVGSGATVTGTQNGLAFAIGTVTNFGTISGGSSGVQGGGFSFARGAVVTNYGNISGSIGITPGTNGIVTNYGTIRYVW